MLVGTLVQWHVKTGSASSQRRPAAEAKRS